jgi:hypothetical protein
MFVLKTFLDFDKCSGNMFLLIPTTLHVQPGIQGIKLKVGEQREEKRGTEHVVLVLSILKESLVNVHSRVDQQ